MPELSAQETSSSVSFHRAAAPAAKTMDRHLDELVTLVKWALEREEDAAATIFRLAYRIEADSDLAVLARSYAADVREFAERLRRMLPSQDLVAGQRSDIGKVSDSVIQSLPPDKVAAFLITFLVQHADNTSDILQSAGGLLGSRQMEMLWRKADRDRRKLATWVREVERQLSARREAPAAARNAAKLAEAQCRDTAQRQLVIWM